MKFSTIICCLVLLPMTVSLGENYNLISNGDFSNGLSGWESYNYTELSEPAQSGIQYAWVATSGGAAGGLVIQGAMTAEGAGIEQVFPIGDVNQYTFTYNYGYTNIGGRGGVEIYWLDETQSQIPGLYHASDFDWTKQPDPNPSDGVYNNSSQNTFSVFPSIWISKAVITMTRKSDYNVNDMNDVWSTIPVNAKYGKIRLVEYYTGYRVYFDNVVFEPVPEQCGDPGTRYLQGDFNRNCIIDMSDFAQFAGAWLACSDPNPTLCP